MNLAGLLMVVVLNLSHFHSMRCTAGDDKGKADSSQGGQKILVFGGNGFIESETVRRLRFSTEEISLITIVNRGNWYFDSEERIKPYVSAHFKCNRDRN